MKTLLAAASSYTIQSEIVWTAALAGFLVALSYAGTWAMSHKESLEKQRFWRLTFRHLGAIAFATGAILIWRHQLHMGIVALGAAAAGVLVTFRESWMSLMSFWVSVGRRHYSLDDFIEVDGVRGKVIDITWLATVLAETGPGKDGLAYSGRLVHIPNYKLMQQPLFVENFTGEYAAHMLNVPLPLGSEPLSAEKLLLDAAYKHCAEFVSQAEEHMQDLQRAQAMDTPSVEPKTHIRIGEEGAITLTLRVVVPFTERQRIEQAILHSFFEAVSEREWPRPAITAS